MWLYWAILGLRKNYWKKRWTTGIKVAPLYQIVIGAILKGLPQYMEIQNLLDLNTLILQNNYYYNTTLLGTTYFNNS